MSGEATVEVTVRHATDQDEVTLLVPEKSQLSDLKDALAEHIDRPEVYEAEFLKSLPNGDFIPLKDTMWLGARRIFFIRGSPLYPPPPPRPPRSVEDMDEFDPEEYIESPRSLRACDLEGLNPEDLIYAPQELYQEKGTKVDPRISRLWHDFFEALRQDHLASVRATRWHLVDQEEEAWSAGSSPIRGSPLEKVVSGNAGRWSGSLEQCQYPTVHQFFRDQVEMSKEAHLFQNASPPFHKGQHDRFGGSTLRRLPPDREPILTGDTPHQAAEKLRSVLTELKRVPNSDKYVEEQRLKTEAEGIVQRAENSKKLLRDQVEAQRLVNCRLDTAEVQIMNKDCEIQYTHWLRKGLDKRATAALLAARPPPTKIQEKNNAIARDRAEYFAKRREVVHEQQLDYESWRGDMLEKQLLEEQAVEERVHQMKNVAGLKYAREWVRRRIRWTKNYSLVGKGVDEWNAATLAKHEAAQKRLDTQKALKQKWIEYRRELQGLRRMYAELSQIREQAKADIRRQQVSEELTRLSGLAFDDSSLSGSQPTSPARSLSSPSRKLDKTLINQAGSPSTSGASSPSSPHVSRARVRRRQPRFDFPRLGAGFVSLTDSASPSKASTLRGSSSAPSLGATGSFALPV